MVIQAGQYKAKKVRNPWNPLLFLAALLTVAGFLYMVTKNQGKKDFLIYKEKQPLLAPWRMEKLQKELEDLDGAEQYVLKARTSGNYPCFSCPDTEIIHLLRGEVWKYGTTSKNEKGRYGNSLAAKNLQYVVEFRGRLDDCLKEEKKKIYFYAIMPENLNRKHPLIRPPGNKNDF